MKCPESDDLIFMFVVIVMILVPVVRLNRHSIVQLFRHSPISVLCYAVLCCGVMLLRCGMLCCFCCCCCDEQVYIDNLNCEDDDLVQQINI